MRVVKPGIGRSGPILLALIRTRFKEEGTKVLHPSQHQVGQGAPRGLSQKSAVLAATATAVTRELCRSGVGVLRIVTSAGHGNRESPVGPQYDSYVKAVIGRQPTKTGSQGLYMDSMFSLLWGLREVEEQV